ncbi:MAG TPA: DUF4352 domain-containing protein [Dehalococcoidia bacterium]|nr:DUF4352 domain-containing protein [Dehalococcoidia bacterium]
MQHDEEISGSLTDGGQYRVTSYMLELTKPDGSIAGTMDVKDMRAVDRKGSTVSVRGRTGRVYPIEGATLDDAGRLETALRSIISANGQTATVQRGGGAVGKIIGIGCGGFVLLAIVVGIVAAIGASSKTNTNKSVAGQTGAGAAASGSQAGGRSSSTLSSNQAQIGDLLLTVNGTQPYADQIFPAEAGTHYIAVDITAQNTGGKTYNLNRLNFHLKDSAGFANTPAITDGPTPQLNFNDMVPGQSVRGFIVFKLGDGRTPTELQYQSFTGTAGTIKITQ